MITKDEIKSTLPAKIRPNVTDEIVNKLNKLNTDPIIAENIKENFISYSQVLMDGKYKMEDYLNAVKYVSYKLMSLSNQEAYFKTFPDRHTRLVANGCSSKDISSYVSAYNKNKLVNVIMEQSLIPSWVLNQDSFQKAINTQLELMIGAKSEMVRCKAADSLLGHLAKPESTAPQINIDIGSANGIGELREAIVNLANKQQELINKGVSAKTIIEEEIIDVNSN